MIKILIASHGYYAKGAESALEIIIGNRSNVTYLSAYVEDKSLKEDVEEYFKGVSEEDSVIILTDLFGGSVNQTLTSYVKRENTYIISGFNLALLLEILLLDSDSSVDVNRLREIVEGSRQQIIFLNDCLQEESNKDSQEDTELFD
ncbi:PTS sugar transporter subunit IIA [Clostridium polynesiense]|uniref:PTS sugar transporter subunit IIA n=1 Tax=Clostridium polynesiense TaxID=1325933 RepID=UPI000590ECA3|nr:hypothetical protein [Clostridium polynesiense]